MAQPSIIPPNAKFVPQDASKVTLHTSSEDPTMIRKRLFAGCLNIELCRRESVIELFSMFGPLLGVTYFDRGGYAFVQFAREEDAQDACANLKGFMWFGHRMDVKFISAQLKKSSQSSSVNPRANFDPRSGYNARFPKAFANQRPPPPTRPYARGVAFGGFPPPPAPRPQPLGGASNSTTHRYAAPVTHQWQTTPAAQYNSNNQPLGERTRGRRGGRDDRPAMQKLREASTRALAECGEFELGSPSPPSDQNANEDEYVEDYNTMTPPGYIDPYVTAPANSRSDGATTTPAAQPTAPDANAAAATVAAAAAEEGEVHSKPPSPDAPKTFDCEAFEEAKTEARHAEILAKIYQPADNEEGAILDQDEVPDVLICGGCHLISANAQYFYDHRTRPCDRKPVVIQKQEPSSFSCFHCSEPCKNSWDLIAHMGRKHNIVLYREPSAQTIEYPKEA